MTRLMASLEAAFGQTPSQTVGPYFAYGLTPRQYGYAFPQAVDNRLAMPGAPGEAICIEGVVWDGEDQPVADALVEIAQCDALGNSAPSAHFTGLGRCGTGTEAGNTFRFHTVKPAAASAGHAPQVQVVALMRGLLLHAFTRIYFGDEEAANASDPLLQRLAAARRATLIAPRRMQDGLAVYRFDIRMQGPRETVFLDL